MLDSLVTGLICIFIAKALDLYIESRKRSGDRLLPLESQNRGHDKPSLPTEVEPLRNAKLPE